MKFLNYVFCGRNVTTRNQRKLQVEQPKQALGLVSTEIQDDPNKLPEHLHEEFCDTVLPDRYLSKDSPDKLMLEALKELNIKDLKDILCKNVPPDKQFQKKNEGHQISAIWNQVEEM